MNPIILKTIKRCITIIFLMAMLGVCYWLWEDKNTQENQLEFVSPSVLYFDYNLSRPDWITREIVREEVEQLVKVNKYTYIEDDLPYPTRGTADVRKLEVVMDKDLSITEFTFCFMHELVHIKYKTSDERFCNFKTWQLLYESDNGYFRNVAMYFANQDLHGAFEYDYRFAGHVEEYLRNN